jgi:hypothetical protein
MVAFWAEMGVAYLEINKLPNIWYDERREEFEI